MHLNEICTLQLINHSEEQAKCDHEQKFATHYGLSLSLVDSLHGKVLSTLYAQSFVLSFILLKNACNVKCTCPTKMQRQTAHFTVLHWILLCRR